MKLTANHVRMASEYLDQTFGPKGWRTVRDKSPASRSLGVFAERRIGKRVVAFELGCTRDLAVCKLAWRYGWKGAERPSTCAKAKRRPITASEFLDGVFTPEGWAASRVLSKNAGDEGPSYVSKAWRIMGEGRGPSEVADTPAEAIFKLAARYGYRKGMTHLPCDEEQTLRLTWEPGADQSAPMTVLGGRRLAGIAYLMSDREMFYWSVMFAGEVVARGYRASLPLAHKAACREARAFVKAAYKMGLAK